MSGQVTNILPVRIVAIASLVMSTAISTITWAQTPVVNEDQKVYASDGGFLDIFGASVAIDADVLVVGAFGDDDRGIGSGSAYVYRWDGVAWVEEQKLLASDGAAGDIFGWSVAVSGDVIVVGADQNDDLGVDSGSAYIFRWNGVDWVEEQKLLASDGAASDRFGFSVAVSGDLIVASSRGDDDLGDASGSAYVYRWNGAAWVEIQKLTASDGAAQDVFGEIAADGDSIVVGAVGDDDLGLTAGSVYVYRWTGVDFVQEQKLLASDGAAGDAFGEAVSVSGNVIAVGTGENDDLGSRSGSAYIFRWSGTAWVEEQKLLASDGAAVDLFGWSVAVNGDVVVVGAMGNDDLGDASGSAYIFRWNGAAWVEEEKLLASDGMGRDFFGYSVAVSGDVVVGARLGDGNSGTTGSTYVFFSLGWIDSDTDGLSDSDEINIYGTDPNDPDTDDDGLLDGVEVEAALASGTNCPDPLDPDSDDDGWLDGHEVLITGTSPCLADTDGDGLVDSVDPTPLEPGATSGWLEDQTRLLADLVAALDPSKFDGTSDGARKAKRNVLANQLRIAANSIARGQHSTAINTLTSILTRIDGESPEPDWMTASPDQEFLRGEVEVLIALLLIG